VDPFAYQPVVPENTPLTQVPPKSALPNEPEVVLVKESSTDPVNHCFQLVLSFKSLILIHALVAAAQVLELVFT
jgi:hypothetical protein